jgi:hypothetical protein
MWVHVTTACRVLELRLEEKASRFGSCEYTEKAVADSRKAVVLHFGGWARGQQLFTIKTNMLQNVTQGLGVVRILWNDLGNGKDMRFITWNVKSLYSAGSLKTVSSELAKCNVDLVTSQQFR